jgi:uncharacterized membrane protein
MGDIHMRIMTSNLYQSAGGKATQSHLDPRTSSPATGKGSTQRLLWLDGLRGLIMVLMALDHASYFIARVHPGEFWGVPLPIYPDVVHFLTRLITHFCAPGFFFLMGTSMILFTDSRRQIGWPDRWITRFFALRGFILIILQLLLENPAWALGILSGTTHTTRPPGSGEMVLLHFGVLYALGAAMIFWSFFLRFRSAVFVSLSIIAILATQSLIPSADNAGILYSPWLRLLLIPGQTGIWQVFYPCIPWLGLTGLGLAFGRLLRQNRNRAYRSALIGGTAFLLLFGLFRTLSNFGDFHAPGNSWIDFFNLTKYPPSLEFILLTLGFDLLLLFLLSKVETQLQSWGKFLVLFGSTALFFYVAHLYLYALIGFAFPNGTSFSLMYFLWFLGLVLLYPMCLWYRRFKERKPPESVWRFF